MAPFEFEDGPFCLFCRTAAQFAVGSILGANGKGGIAVAIYRLLQTLVFEPEDIEKLAMAYEDALRALQLFDRDDPITEIIAKRIIEAARTGERDPAMLCTLAIKDLRVP